MNDAPVSIKEPKPGDTETVDSVWLAQLRKEYQQYGTVNAMLREELTKTLDAKDQALDWLGQRDQHYHDLRTQLTTLTRLLDSTQQVLTTAITDRAAAQSSLDDIKHRYHIQSGTITKIRQQRNRALVGRNFVEREFILRGVIHSSVPADSPMRTHAPSNKDASYKGNDGNESIDYSTAALNGRGAQNWPTEHVTPSGDIVQDYDTVAPKLPEVSVALSDSPSPLLHMQQVGRGARVVMQPVCKHEWLGEECVVCGLERPDKPARK